MNKRNLSSTKKSSQKSSQREILIRKCVATKERLPKDKLLRIVRVDGVAIIDPTGTRAGRGAYITPDVNTIKKARKKNALARALRIKVDEKIYDELLKMVGD